MQVTESCRIINVCPVAAITALRLVTRPSFALEVKIHEEPCNNAASPDTSALTLDEADGIVAGFPALSIVTLSPAASSTWNSMHPF